MVGKERSTGSKSVFNENTGKFTATKTKSFGGKRKHESRTGGGRGGDQKKTRGGRSQNKRQRK